MDISITLVNYNTRNWLEKCIDSIYRHTKNISFEIIVTDNVSTDGSREMVRQRFPGAKLIENTENEYVAKGFNHAVRESSGKYVVVMDPDIELKENIFLAFFRYMESHESTAAVGGPFYKTNGEFMSFCYNRDNSWLYSALNHTLFGKIFYKKAKETQENYEYKGWDRKSSRNVDWLDTLLFIRRKVFIDAGMYDERFKLYFIQNDLCRRMRKMGWDIYYLFEGHTVHAKGESVFKKESWEKISSFHRKDLSTYISKYYGYIPAKLLMLMIGITRCLLYAGIKFKLYSPRNRNIVLGILPENESMN